MVWCFINWILLILKSITTFFFPSNYSYYDFSYENNGSCFRLSCVNMKQNQYGVKLKESSESFPSSLSVLQVTVHSPIIQMVPGLKGANNYLFIKEKLLRFRKPLQPHPHFKLPWALSWSCSVAGRASQKVRDAWTVLFPPHFVEIYLPSWLPNLLLPLCVLLLWFLICWPCSIPSTGNSNFSQHLGHLPQG